MLFFRLFPWEQRYSCPIRHGSDLSTTCKVFLFIYYLQKKAYILPAIKISLLRRFRADSFKKRGFIPIVLKLREVCAEKTDRRTWLDRRSSEADQEYKSKTSPSLVYTFIGSETSPSLLQTSN